MNKYKIFDGINWVDVCNCSVRVKTLAQWKEIDPWNCTTKYWDGANWCEIICCECPEGFIYNPIIRKCERYDVIAATPDDGATIYNIVGGGDSAAYGNFGARLYEDISTKIFPLNGWQNDTICTTCANGYQVFENSGTGSLITIQSTSVIGNTVFTNAAANNVDGRLNAVGIWATGYPANQWLDVEFCIDISTTKTYIFAIAGDNQIKAGITSTTFNGGVTNFNLVNIWGSNSPTGSPTSSGKPNSFKIWHMFPITLPAGLHTLQLSGMDFGTPASFGAEIYDISEADLMTLMADPTMTVADLEPYILFSSASLVSTPPLVVGAPGETIIWTCPDGYTLDGCLGVPSCVLSEVVPCNSAERCSVYSNILNFGLKEGYNSIQYLCGETQVAACYNIGNITDMASLLAMFNSPPPDPLPDYCDNPVFCLCWTAYGAYFDNGDNTIRLELTPEGLARLGCGCNDLSIRVIRD
jgi:hypothetical protein